MNINLKAARLEFLDDGVGFYSEDTSRRAVKYGGGCAYKTDDGDKCFIGRHIPDDKYNPRLEDYTLNIVMDVLPEEIRSLGSAFLRDCQRLHDNDDNWDENGLTKLGKMTVERIKEDFC